MRSIVRVVLTSLVLSAGFLTAACDTFDFDIWDTKKKLPGERKPVFPGGVPGVSQGVPPEYLPGYQDPTAQPPQTDSAKAETGAPGKPDQAAAAKPEAKPKPKPRPAAQAQKPAAQAQAPRQPAPAQAAAPREQAPGPAQPWPAPQPQAAWPSPPPPGQFSR